jgi:predicted O-methyltransferase YrrM
MSKDIWTAVDRYITDALLPEDLALDETLRANHAAGLPTIDVSPAQGKFLHLLAKIQGAKRILEIGTLGGYSTIWLARALPPNGVLVTLEFDPRHAEVAASNIARAGFAAQVNVRVGAALESLAAMQAEGVAGFDLIFIDADKSNSPVYVQWALRLSHVGSIIVVDNVIRDGHLLDTDSKDPNVHGGRRVFEMLSVEPRLEATALQTVGTKGYDGFVLARVVG